MNSNELNHNQVSETPHGGSDLAQTNGPRAVLDSQQTAARNDFQSDSTLLVQPDGLRAGDGSLSAGESMDKPKSPSKRVRVALAIIPLLIIAGLALGFLPRWRQSRLTATDTSQLAIPSVSVASATLEINRDGLVLPAEVRPWLEASIFARAN